MLIFAQVTVNYSTLCLFFDQEHGIYQLYQTVYIS